MSIIEAIVQGIVQGLTEFLPVSSSGHLSLVQHFFGIDGNTAVASSIVMHLGTLVAVFIAFRHRIWQLILEALSMIKDIFTGKFKWSKMNDNRRMIMLIIISILPLFIFFIFRDFFEGISSDSDITVEGFAFLYTSVILFLSCKFGSNSKDIGDATVKDALVIGTFQGIALVPGISRSGSTISAALFCGMKRETAVEYSFILGIPVILAGAVVELKDFNAAENSEHILPLLIGFAVSAVVGFLAIKLVKWLIKDGKFKVFAYYTLILGILVVAAGFFEHHIGMTIPEYLAK